jgi:anti-anti-sigma factor
MLQVRERQQYHTKILTLEGEYTRHSTAGIQARILASQETDCHHIILDFSDVTQIDSSDLGELFLWYQSMRSFLIQISIVKPPPHVRSHVDWSYLSEIVPVYESKLRPWSKSFSPQSRT